MKYFFYFLPLLFLAGCKKEEAKSSGPKIVANFTLESTKFVFQDDLSKGGSQGYGRNSFGPVSGNSDNAIFFGIHYSDSVISIVNSHSSSEDQDNSLIQALPFFNNKFAVISDTVYLATPTKILSCWTCYLDFTKNDLSITYMSHISDNSKKEIWSTVYGEQTGSTMTMTNFKIIKVKEENSPTGSLVYIVADMIFSCVVYDKNGDSKPITGSATAVVYTRV